MEQRRLASVVILGLLIGVLALPAWGYQCQGRTGCGTTTTTVQETTTTEAQSTTTVQDTTTTTGIGTTSTTSSDTTTTSTDATTTTTDPVSSTTQPSTSSSSTLPFTGVSRFTWMTLVFVAGVSSVLGFMFVMAARDEE